MELNLELPLWVESINCYLFLGEDGWDILDTGIYTPQALDKWQKTLHRLGIKAREVRKIVISHDHVDHFGAAGQLQKLTQAPVQMVINESSLVNLEEWLELLLNENDFDYFGLPPELKVQVIREKIRQFKSWVPSLPEIEDLSGSHVIRLGKEDYQIHRLAGHSPNQICFYHPEKEVVFAGDVLVTPNHLNLPGEDPLGDYFASLEELQKLPATVLIPAHGKPFNRVAVRIELIANYRKQQLVSLRDYLIKEKTVYQAYLFLLSSGGALSDAFFGLTEIFYFLEHLRKRENLARVTKKGCYYYQSMGGGELG